jgi:hypothetical protein
VAWFRAMGVDHVAYHEATVVGREDDHPGQALDYYGSRGETPLRWGGAGATRLGLQGEVTPDGYRLAFGPGGFRDPLTGQRLVRTTRPGFELVVSAHKSLSLLGVVGRADDMHAIVDAQTAATMACLEGWAQSRGGRRGRAAVAPSGWGGRAVGAERRRVVTWWLRKLPASLHLSRVASDKSDEPMPAAH